MSSSLESSFNKSNKDHWYEKVKKRLHGAGEGDGAFSYLQSLSQVAVSLQVVSFPRDPVAYPPIR